jgi:hypothetical protein
MAIAFSRNFFLHWGIDELTWVPSVEQRTVKRWWFQKDREWYEIYNFVDFLARRLTDNESENSEVVSTFNAALQYEGSSYRFVGD